MYVKLAHRFKRSRCKSRNIGDRIRTKAHVAQHLNEKRRPFSIAFPITLRTVHNYHGSIIPASFQVGSQFQRLQTIFVFRRRFGDRTDTLKPAAYCQKTLSQNNLPCFPVHCTWPLAEMISACRAWVIAIPKHSSLINLQIVNTQFGIYLAIELMTRQLL